MISTNSSSAFHLRGLEDAAMRVPLPVIRHNTLWLFLFVVGLLWLPDQQQALAQTPVLYYTLNENSGGGGENPFWADSSGNGFNGSCPAGHCPNGGSAGIGNTTAALYQSVDDYINVVPAPSLLKPASTVTVSA